LGSSIPILPNAFHITHTQNPGAAFGLFPNATMLLVVVALFVSAILLWLGRQGFDRRRVAVATGMMLGGALGNLIDRIRFGAVTDFIDLRVWPIFNLADTALTMGAFLLLWWGAFAPSSQDEGREEKSQLSS
ncbi:MAG: signal peptidase II, partial [Armatimonadota bacterium]